MAEQEEFPKAVLYNFVPGSVWSAVAVLTAIEKGFTDDQLEKRTVNLVKGENFAPAFLKISPSGHLPVLVAPIDYTTSSEIPTKFKAITGTAAVAQFLDSSTLSTSTHNAPSLSPATIDGNTLNKEVVDKLHDEAVDPNALLLSARNAQELNEKSKGLVGQFLTGRQDALERYAKQVEGNEGDKSLKAFYEKKIAENGHLLAVFEGKTSPDGWFATSNKLWAAVPALLDYLEATLPGGTAKYIGGDQLSLADIHATAYFARLFAVSGAASSPFSVDAGVLALEKQLPDYKLGRKTVAYLAELFAREAPKKVYEGGFF